MNPLADIVSILFPKSCHICRCRLADHERFICRQCVERLPRTLYHRVPLNAMEQRFAGIVKFERATACFTYSRKSGIATLIHDFKYRGFPSLACYMGEMMATELYTSGFFADIDCIAPVPLHILKRARRGYNQSEMIARGVSKVTGIPVIANLTAQRRHSTQTAKDHYQRWQNTMGIFAVKRPNELEGKHVLIVDDVCTTGATLIAAADTILKVADTRISILSLAVTIQ